MLIYVEKFLMHATLLQSASVSKLCMVASSYLTPLIKEEYFVANICLITFTPVCQW